MKKQEFIASLRARLGDLPRQDVEERIGFYSEMIDDGIEDGLTEVEAVGRVGSVEELAEQIQGVRSSVVFIEATDAPKGNQNRQRVNRPKRRLKTWEIVLLAVGSVVWVPLAIAALAVIFALYAVLWSVVISLWAVSVALFGGAVVGVLGGVFIIPMGHPAAGIAFVGAGLVCGGLAVLWFFVCKAATKGAAFLTRGICLGIGNCFRRREREL